jgi:hypothetical protein
MTRNVELLQATMQHILDHPEQHYQTQWVTECGTAACFAGWAALRSGVSVQTILSSDMWRLGAELLGISVFESLTLFAPGNTRAMLELMVKDLVNGDELRTTDDYEAES